MRNVPSGDALGSFPDHPPRTNGRPENRHSRVSVARADRIAGTGTFLACFVGRSSAIPQGSRILPSRPKASTRRQRSPRYGRRSLDRPAVRMNGQQPVTGEPEQVRGLRHVARIDGSGPRPAIVMRDHRVVWQILIAFHVVSPHQRNDPAILHLADTRFKRNHLPA